MNEKYINLIKEANELIKEAKDTIEELARENQELKDENNTLRAQLNAQIDVKKAAADMGELDLNQERSPEEGSAKEVLLSQWYNSNNSF